MSTAIVSELRKIRSTRLWWILLLCMVAGVAFMTATIGFSFAFAEEIGGSGVEGGGADMDPVATARIIYTLPVSFGYVFPVIVGALAVTSEFRHRTIDTTLLLEPSRAKVIGAKFVAVIPFALIYAVVGVATGVGVGAGALMLGGEPTGLDSAEVWRTLGMSVVALTAWGLVGVGFGTALTNQVVVIVALLGWTQLVEPIVRFGLAFVDPIAGAGKFMPGAAGEAIAGASFYSTAGVGDLLAPWAGLLVLLGYAVIAAVIGWLITFRKDIS
ncbi:ABC transporter permease [Demequina muriae]|uniref:ABC transporter permease n=1 Tax=Demequina muriae TaxID=3051664 RepID=A0ABT8GHY0_9MICO|nr:ABC transporter permease [Demequina sp. EGI L300058]MDN4481046.1 ABC transporter permease [Demequina sp. EGI L300058]